jgi:transposase
MQLKTILNRVQKFKRFVYGEARWENGSDGEVLVIEVRPRQNSRPICSGCHRPAPGYDRLQPRLFEFVPLWGIAVFFLYVMRRVDCKRCGVKVEAVPWAEGKQTLTRAYMHFLATWAKRMSWKEVAEIFRTSWEKVYRSVEWIVEWGLAHRDLTGITAIGIDELLWRKGHQYISVVYQIDAHCRRLLWVGRDRTAATVNTFFDEFGEQRIENLRFICSDMWKQFIDVIRRRAPQALHVLDRFHIVSYLNRAIDLVRAQEVKELKRKGFEPILKRTRWCLLKRPENRTELQNVRLAELLQYNLKIVRSFLLKEDFQFFWEYTSPHWAGCFLDNWCSRTMRSKIEPMKKVARMLRAHRELLLNWFRARKQISAGVVEGFNNKAKLTTRKAYGFRTFRTIQVALYHNLGALPEPEMPHRFC